MAEHNELGKKGEIIAAEYLKSRGVEILEKNYVYNHKEIDIIAQDRNYIVFVEVKSRSSNVTDIEEIVDEQKQKFLIEAADNYLRDRKIEFEARFDIIIIKFHITSHVIKHIKNAFEPSF
jgi:putative endonuclease